MSSFDGGSFVGDGGGGGNLCGEGGGDAVGCRAAGGVGEDSCGCSGGVCNTVAA